MLATDHDEFDAQLAKLCAGFGVPVTQGRKDAYWSALSKMTLAQFARVVDHAISEDGPSDIPIPKRVWPLLQALRAPAPGTQAAAPKVEQRDHLHFLANRLLLRFMINRGGFGSKTAQPSILLGDLRAAAADLVEYFRPAVIEDEHPDCTPAAFIEMLIRAVSKITPIDPTTLADWNRIGSSALAHEPFPSYMARRLAADPVQPQNALQFA